MSGLLRKILHEVTVITGLFSLALFVMNAAVTFMLPQFQDSFPALLDQVPFLRAMVTAMMGTSLGETINAQMMQGILWLHPVVLTIVWAYEIVYCTRVPAGEVDRGTVDILLSWPVSRRQIYVAETIGWLLGGIIVLTVGWCGHLVLRGQCPEALRPDGVRMLTIEANFFALYMAIGGIAFLASALSSRRGRAVGIAATVVIVSYFLNFLAQLWAPARSVGFLSLMAYYQPARTLTDSIVPVGDMAVLVGVGLVTWAIGLEIFARRNVCTV